jgi:protein-disulfide isomerase
MKWLVLLGTPVTRIAFQLVTFLFLALACFGQQDGKLPARTSVSTSRQVTIIEFADFQCPFCASQAADLRKLQAEYSESLTVTFKNFPLPFHKQSKPAHLAALAAGEQGKFWEMHDLIYGHPEHLFPEDFDRYAVELGLDKEQFRHSLSDPGPSDVIEKDIAEGKALGVNATPTFVVNGHKMVGRQSYARLKQIIAAELKGEPWGRAVPLSVDISNAPSQGRESAPVTIVEFSDFQCPFCARALASVQRLIKANREDVRFVFKNFPLDFHPDSRRAHTAALAAGEQGRFWEMHDLLFAHQTTLRRTDLLDLASQLGLDMAKFQKDLDNPQLRAKIEDDKREGERLGVSATPTFVVNGEAIAGFSAEKLQARIDEEMSLARAHQAPVPTNLPDLDLSLGPKDAPMKVQWYVDLTSPLTAKSAVALQQFLATHVGAVRVEFKNFPLQNHDSAMLVHEFALAAAAQGKFWSVESLLLADPKPKDREELKILASQAGIDQNRLWAEVDAHKYSSFISNDLVQAKRIGVSGTPTFVVGDKKLDGVDGLAAIP